MDMEMGGYEGFIPALPDDVALQCLLRVPVESHAQLQGVSRKWRELVNSSQFYEERKKEGTTNHYVCMTQALSQLPSASMEKQDALRPVPSAAYGISIFNVQQRVWDRLPQIPDFSEGLPLYCRIVAVGGKLVVLGGWNPSTWETLRSVYVYNFSTQSWRRGADMPSFRSFFACGAMGDHVFVAGGHDNGKTALATAEVYSVESNRWESLPSMTEERDEGTGVVLDGKFYVVTGYPSTGQGQFVKSAEVYDPANNAWYKIEGMCTLGSPIGTNPGALTVMSGSLYAFNGQQLVCYSTTKNAWNVVESLPRGEKGDTNPVCVTAVNNTLVVNGPARGSEDQSYKTLVYRPATSKNSKSEWEMVASNEEFLGIAQISCAIEI